MFGASVVRQKRERERRERALKELDPPVIPYIKPFGARFDASQLPYFKYRQALAELEAEKQRLEAETPPTQTAGAKGGSVKAELLAAASPPARQEEGGVSALLYVGLGLVAVGMVITFVGLGDKGFKSLQLRLIGPGLVSLGLLLTVVRVLLCTIPPYIDGCRKGKSGSAEEAAISINGPLPNGQAVKIPPGGQYPSESPRGKVAFAQTPQNPPKTPQNLKQEDRSKEARSVSAMDWEEEEEKNSLSSSSASSTFGPGEENVPPFLVRNGPNAQNGQRIDRSDQTLVPDAVSSVSKGKDNNDASDQIFGREKVQTPKFISANGSTDRETGGTHQDIENGYFDHNELEQVDRRVESLPFDNNSSSDIQMGKYEPSLPSCSDIESLRRKCSLSESRTSSASNCINSSLISSKLFNAETLDVNEIASQ